MFTPFAPWRRPSLLISILPIATLLGTLLIILCTAGADAISQYSTEALLGSAILSVALAAMTGCLSRRGMTVGFRRSARQILPAVPMLIFIATVSTTWMLSGVVPTLIDYGISIINPTMFLMTTCVVCAGISVLTGSSWSTIATIGVAFMGIGTVMGFSAGWIAGAIISGAYFGDKVSALSDTTVVASSTCGVDLFDHIRYLMITAIPSMGIALIVFTMVGVFTHATPDATSADILHHLESTFVISPKILIIPVVTAAMIMLRVPTLLTLALSSAMGLAGIFLFQPQLVARLMETAGDHNYLSLIGNILWSETSMSTGYELLDNLVTTGGITGMLPTVALVLCAMTFGTAMIGTGMLERITRAFTGSLRRRVSIVGATVGSGLFLNSCTADQYLSIIIGGNMYRNLYRRYGMEPRLLSRTLEDSVSVTSVLIPWNSCGVTQSMVLGVPTLAYLPYCVFNYLSPIMSLAVAITGFKIHSAVTSAMRHAVARA
ncbi:MAG: sodium:proton antiporter [Duncaniella sp.]|nr:sodium:proton antiporter [Duncaniella sp.]